MNDHTASSFDIARFLSTPGSGRKIMQFRQNSSFFTAGDPANCIYFLQRGTAKLGAMSSSGKEATVTFINPGEFLREESAGAERCARTCTVTAVTACTAMRIERLEIIRVMHDEHAFMDVFVEFLLARCQRRQEDVIALLLNSSEKRLARLLLLMTDHHATGAASVLLPKISQLALAEVVGTTRSRVSFFMTRFRSLGLIECGTRVLVHRGLLISVLEKQDVVYRPVAPVASWAADVVAAYAVYS